MSPALRSLVSTNIPTILAVVPLILVAVALDVNALLDPPNCLKVSTNFPAVIGLVPQIELLF